MSQMWCQMKDNQYEILSVGVYKENEVVNYPKQSNIPL